jgi:hypothetical protein
MRVEQVSRCPHILDSLIRAQELGIIPDQGCRVDISGTGSYLRFKPEWESTDPILRDNQNPDTIELTLEEIDATRLRTWLRSDRALRTKPMAL